jgi:hypothetical protein
MFCFKTIYLHGKIKQIGQLLHQATALFVLFLEKKFYFNVIDRFVIAPVKECNYNV